MPAAEMAGRSIFDFMHPEDRAIARAEMRRQVQSDAASAVIEVRKRHRDGYYIWMEVKLKAAVDPVTDMKDGVLAVSRDISRERQAREALGRSEARFLSLTRLSSDWYWETDEHDCFTFFSEGLQRMSAIAPEYLLGKSRGELAMDPEDVSLQAYRDSVARRQPFRNLVFAANFPPDGQWHCFHISGEPVYADGVFQGYRGVGTGITADKEISLKLEQLAQENRALIEHSPDMLMLIDGTGTIIRVTGPIQRVIGYEPGEVIGRPYLEFVTANTREATLDAVAVILAGNTDIPEFENCWVRKDGGIVHLSWAVRRLAEQGLTYVSARDVTERHQARVALYQANERLSTILDSIGDAFFAVDRNWRITYANSKSMAFASGKPRAMVGEILWEAVPELLASPVFSYYQQAMQTRENVFFDAYYAPTDTWIEARVFAHEDGLSVFFHDIGERRNAERAVRESEQRFREMIEITPAGYVATDASGIVRDVNPAMCELTGCAREEFIGRDILHFLPACPMDGALRIKGGASTAQAKETVLLHKSGHPVYVLLNLSIRRDAQGNALSMTAFVTDITERKKTESQLERLATHDSLTGLPNRALINQRLQAMLDAARPEDSIAVMFIDLDRFKEVNDSMGHAPGDVLLGQVALRLQTSMRPGDIVARLGGDEFVVAAYCSEGRESAAAIAGKLLATLSSPFDIEGNEVFVSASIGISMFAEDGNTKEILFQNADVAMYKAKSGGRNGYRFFEAEMSVEAKSRMVLEHALRRALERGEFELEYQPRVNLKTMAVVGMEALIRWNHPQLGRIPPMKFIPIAEDRGLIEPIGQWVLEEACRQTARLGVMFRRRLHVSVNMSARQLKCVNLAEQVENALKEAGLPGDLLELELTESALIDDMDASVDVLKKLKTLRILLSIDDFGTGYSGLSYLRRFPVDILKLDRSFVRQQSGEASSAEFIKAFVGMSHALRMSVVAEGIETPETLQLLRDAACDEGQGYLFAKPLSLGELEAFLSRLPVID